MELNRVNRDLNQFEIVVLLFGAANASLNKAQQFHTHFLVLISLLSQSSIFEEEF